MFLTDLFSRHAKSCWVPPGEASEAAGFVLPRGMIYVGTELRAVANKSAEPSLINPRLPVDSVQPSKTFRWSSDVTGYAAIGAKVKALYLQWLSEGRKSAETSTGCLMLFLFGVERRVLHDWAQPQMHDVVGAELPAIIAELERLVARYGEPHPVFKAQTLKLLAYLAAMRDPHAKGVDDWRGYLHPVEPGSSERAHRDVRVALGRAALSGGPLPPDLAYCGYLHLPAIPKRDAHRVCGDLHRQLFEAEYARQYGAGLELEGRFEKMSALYQPVSPTFGEVEFEALLEVPDVMRDAGFVRKLEQLGHYCDNQLSDYVRLLNTQPEKQGTLEALAALPLQSWPIGRRFRFERLVAQMKAEDRPQTLPYAKLLAWLPRYTGRPLDKLGVLARVLSKWGLAVEPSAPSEAHAQDPVALYRVQDGNARPLAGEYERAELACRLLVFIVRAEGAFAGTEFDVLSGALGHWPTLTLAQKDRLRARLCLWLAQAEGVLEGTTQALAALSAKDKARIGEFLFAVAEHVGIEGSALSRILAQMSTRKTKKARGATVPVMLREEQPGSGFPIPAAPEPVRPKVSLDLARIAQLQVESEEVSSMLGAIFSEEPTIVAPLVVAPITGVSATPSLLGLDQRHAAFARRLIAQASWSRTELEVLAVAEGLMLEGALERINEAAYDHYDDPLFEGADPVELNLSVAKELA